MKNIFIIGSKGIPANYGGFETFVDKLTENKKTKEIRYHVSCLSNDEEEFVYNNARCFNVKVPNIGAAKAVYYDIKALEMSLNYIEQNKIENCIIYILACRIGPFMWKYKKRANELGVKIYVNPDGHEWKRAKWNCIIRQYWKISEKLMVKHSDLLVCDSINIEKYIKEDYKKYSPRTTYISYGAEYATIDIYDEDKLKSWYDEKKVKPNNYYLIVGRFVPENNYEVMIEEFMKSNIMKDLVIITNVEENKFYNSLNKKTNFQKDKRIKFVGTVYDKKLLELIRKNAYGYIHGHEVGGTNPSLLEALATTKINLLLDVGFNKEVAEEGALYFNKKPDNLRNILEEIDNLDQQEIDRISEKAKRRIKENYTWDYIVKLYEKLFLEKE